MFSAILYLLINTMSESSVIWVKEAKPNSSVFNIPASSITHVCNLKDAIAGKKKFNFAADELSIHKPGTENDAEEAGDTPISELTAGKLGTDPIYFSQPAPPGKFIMSLSYILCLYFAVTVLYIFMLF